MPNIDSTLAIHWNPFYGVLGGGQGGQQGNGSAGLRLLRTITLPSTHSFGGSDPMFIIGERLFAGGLLNKSTNKYDPHVFNWKTGEKISVFEDSELVTSTDNYLIVLKKRGSDIGSIDIVDVNTLQKLREIPFPNNESGVALTLSENKEELYLFTVSRSNQKNIVRRYSLVNGNKISERISAYNQSTEWIRPLQADDKMVIRSSSNPTSAKLVDIPTYISNGEGTVLSFKVYHSSGLQVLQSTRTEDYLYVYPNGYLSTPEDNPMIRVKVGNYKKIFNNLGSKHFGTAAIVPNLRKEEGEFVFTHSHTPIRYKGTNEEIVPLRWYSTLDKSMYETKDGGLLCQLYTKHVDRRKGDAAITELDGHSGLHMINPSGLRVTNLDLLTQYLSQKYSPQQMFDGPFDSNYPLHNTACASKEILATHLSKEQSKGENIIYVFNNPFQ